MAIKYITKRAASEVASVLNPQIQAEGFEKEKATTIHNILNFFIDK